jgi:threonine dehydratase
MQSTWENIVEPSGAATVAAALAETGAGPVVAIISGGNVALEKLAELARSRTEADTRVR